MKACLCLTHRCNLACKYCYAGKKFNSDMSLATAKKVIDFIWNMTPSGEEIKIGFSGGEPLLKFDLIKKIISYIHHKNKTSRNSVIFGITSNGTLLTESVIDYILKEEIELCISLDGPPQIHNKNRCYPDGSGTFNDVVKNISLAVNRMANLQVNTVYSPDSVLHLPKSLSLFEQLGISIIHFNPNIRSFSENGNHDAFRNSFMQIADLYIQNYQNRKEIAVNLIDNKIILFLKGGYECTDKCGMGETEWGFAPSGNIYPCERLIGEDDNQSLCLGNVYTGFNTTNRCEILKNRGNSDKKCLDCEYQNYCMNWCGCTNYHMTGYTNKVGKMLCESEKAAIKASKHVFTTLYASKNDLFIDHFMKYFKEGRHCQ